MKKMKQNKRRAEELKDLLAMSDDEIDTSDIRELTADDFKRGTRGLMYRPIKKSVTIRLDADVLEWLKGNGPGYQTKANSLLRSEMLKSLSSKKGSGTVTTASPKKRAGSRSR